ncbi:OGFOD1 [Symbiodinium necroappetens]|uniref:OGFOD1 protein n=1 Tax=Symbiodinium necroappetens TaxID=1628268 RepID=A0A813CP12_9DINO|nr:OGFOD1 [Symbiodinium necroappetens]
MELALAAADGTAQAWNEVYRHPARYGWKAYCRRFRQACQLEERALAAYAELRPLGEQWQKKYTKACGLDVDACVGSLMLALNVLPGVRTLSSCNSIHEGAHEEEALVAFAAEVEELAQQVAEAVGQSHFRESQEGVIQPRIAGEKAVAFKSYIVFSVATKAGRPDGLRRLQEMMAAARAVHSLARRLRCAAEATKATEALEPQEPPNIPTKPSEEVQGEGLDVSPLAIDSQLKVKALRKQWSTRHWVQLSPFNLQELCSFRDELVADLKGLQPIETSHTQALVLPLEEAGPSPVLHRLVETFRAQQFRSLVQSITGCSALTSQKCALVAIPPEGQVLPQCFAGEHARGEVAFVLFLPEDWWKEGDGGLFELYAETGKPVARLVPEPGLLLYTAGTGAAITRVLTEDAPQLAVHGLLASDSAEEAASPFLANDLIVPRPVNGGRRCHQKHRALNQWICEKFLDTAWQTDLRAQFEETSHIKLPGFLNERLATQLAAAIGDARLEAWQEAGPVRVQRCLLLGEASACPLGRAMADVGSYMASETFLEFLEALTGVTRSSGSAISLQIRCFRPGLDFQRPRCTQRPQLDVILGFEVASLAGPRSRKRRSMRSMGGADGYVEGDTAHLRTAEASGILAGPGGVPAPLPVLLRLPLRNNVLRLVLRDPKTSHYVEPLQASAPTSRWEICLAVPVEELPSSGEEAEEATAPLSPAPNKSRRRKRGRSRPATASEFKATPRKRRAVAKGKDETNVFVLVLSGSADCLAAAGHECLN